MSKYYLTAAIPYVNASPHIGHAMEFIYVDVIRRYMKLLGYDSVSLSGGDENALKNVQAAAAANLPIQEFVDLHTTEFSKLTNLLNAPFDIWQKSSQVETHHKSSMLLWEKCQANGDIYKKSYTGKYCVGCEAFYEPEELINGECSEHPGKNLETVTEENYFFSLSKYQNQLTKLITSNQLEIVPESRKNEVLQFIKSGLKDISISRSNERAKNWGVMVPNDSNQRMYVWFDALNVYQSGVGFGTDDAKYEQLWPADLHVIGKGIVRFHAVYWPAFLMSAGLKIPNKIFVHDYFTVDGKKMSKTIGNVYNPLPILEKLGADPLRYYCLAKISPFQDSDFSETKMIGAYTSDLANSLGNTVSRIASLCDRSGFDFPPDPASGIRQEIKSAMSEFQFHRAMELIWERIKLVEQQIDNNKPWTLKDAELHTFLIQMVAHLRQISFELTPFLPETSEKITTIFSGPKIYATKPLFPRI